MGSGGYIERENAAIINASILALARETIGGFQVAVATLGLDCPLYLTQNDGTIMSAQAASIAPIKTFSSGATNSLTGAVFLAGLHSPTSNIDLETCQVIMVDVGGTSADFAALSSSGFPRQSPAIVKVGGVRTAFSMPEVLSFGLGGGSRVHEDEAGYVTVGPDSVGYQLSTSSKCFGGSTLTATDIVIASGTSDIGIKPKWINPPEPELVKKARAHMLKTLQKGVDRMKASDLDVVLLLVGGGSIIQIDNMEKVKACVRPPFYDAANAVGAAIAKV
jgi:N-methylhydantoinase A/oxoprolinase/acetone carboxylase beta subunit